jgi:hypothetical protein
MMSPKKQRRVVIVLVALVASAMVLSIAISPGAGL